MKNKIIRFIDKNSSTILTVVGVTGVIGTTILAVKATPKALDLIANAEEEKGSKLTTIETIRVSWTPYIPATLLGLSTIACILGANHLNMKKQVSLITACEFLSNSFRDYQEGVIQNNPEDHENAKKAIMEKYYEPNKVIVAGENDTLFFDFYSLRFFESNMETMVQAEAAFKALMAAQGYASLNMYYALIGLSPTKLGHDIGWSDPEYNNVFGENSLEITYEKVTMTNGLECWNVIFTEEPTIFFRPF